jgi:hypothetical protein
LTKGDLAHVSAHENPSKTVHEPAARFGTVIAAPLASGLEKAHAAEDSQWL